LLKKLKNKIDIEHILSEAILLGRDLESHAGERFTDPANYDAVCDYVAEELDLLARELRLELEQ